VPVSAESLEQAIELNGVAVEFNRQAFLWGRRFAHEPHKVTSLLDEAEDVDEPLTLDQLIDDRAGRLTAYQDHAYAEQYRNDIAQLRSADVRAEQADSLTFSAATQLYRMMAIKDEYEVARLYSDGTFERAVAERFEGDYQLHFNLAPPLIAKRDPATGELRKREFGPWIKQLFRWLAPLKRLRGTPLDVFGYTAERRRERQDLADYRALLAQLASGLEARNYAVAVKLAAGVAKLRGYGHVKDRNRDKVLTQRELLLCEFSGKPVNTDVVRFVEAA
jgi:indolepyruvate ferredoxin oxidoreductase